MDSGAREGDGLGSFFRESAVDEAAARLLAGLTTGSGHALLCGAHASDVEAVLARVDAKLVCHRRLRISGVGLDPEAAVATLGADLASADPPPSAVAILTTLAAQACAAGAPVLMVIARAEEAGVVVLGQLCALLDQVPEARDRIRLLALGGPALGRMLAHPAAHELAARFSTIVQAPPCERAVLETSPSPDGGRRRMQHWAAAAGVTLALGTVGLLAGSVRHWTVSDTGPAVVLAPATSAPDRPLTSARQDAVASVPADAPPSPVPAERVAPPVTAAPAIAPPPASPPVAAGLPTPPRKAPAPAPSAQALQLGAFRSAENAETLREQVARLYPDARVSNVTVKGVQYHRVRLGATSERDLAARAAALQAAGFATVRVRD
jgi:hypothetical protein